MEGASPGFSLNFAVGGSDKKLQVDKPRVVLGRSPNCDVVIPEERISRQHATILLEGASWSVFDMGSANGTFVNEKPIVKCPLRDGDVIMLGEIEITFHLDQKESASNQHRVILESDTSHRNNKTAVFNMAELSVLSSVGDTRRNDSQQAAAWAVGLFSQAAQALLSSDSLDDVLEKVLDLVFKNLPVERGVIALYNEDDGVVPRISRSRLPNTSDTIRISQTIALEAVKLKQAIIVGDAMADERFGGEESILAMNISSAMCAPMYNEGHVSGLLYVDSRNFRKAFTEEHLRLLSTFGVFSAVAVEQTRLRDRVAREQKIRSKLEMYNSKAVVDRIVQGAITGSQTAVGDIISEEREVSVIFSDLCGFTSTSEEMAPQEVAQLLNGVFERLTSAIFACDGTLDKFMGDGMMAFFGAPLEQTDHAERAVRAAMLMLEELEQFNQECQFEHPVSMRIGINSGPVIAGDIGSPKRKDFTVIGDVVNIASRLESSVAKPGHIVIGESTYDLLGGQIKCAALGAVKLKGKEKTVNCFRVEPQ